MGVICLPITTLARLVLGDPHMSTDDRARDHARMLRHAGAGSAAAWLDLASLETFDGGSGRRVEQ